MPTLLEHSIGVLTDLVKCQSPQDTLAFFGIQVLARNHILISEIGQQASQSAVFPCTVNIDAFAGISFRIGIDLISC